MENSSYKNENIETKQLNSWYDWLIICIPNMIRKIVNDFKNKVVSPFKINTPKDYGKKTVYGREKKPSKQKKISEEKSEENIIKSVRNLFKLKKRKMKQLNIE